MGLLPADEVGPCAVCGFDAAEWNAQDSARTLSHTDELIAGWSAGVSSHLGASVDALAATTRTGVAGAETTEMQVHALWHGLVSIANERRAGGDAPATAQGSVAQINRSGGGVPKLAVPTATVGRRGIDGDVQSTRFHHGRPWQALCLWSSEVVAALAADGHPIAPGAAGENLTISGVDWSTLRAGTVVDIGAVRCQLSNPAAPCSKNRKWFTGGDISLMDHTRHPGWSRWYASVLRPGTIAVGDAVIVEPQRP